MLPSVGVLTVVTAVLQQAFAQASSATAPPCLLLQQQVSALVCQFLSSEISPASTFAFEHSLHQLVLDFGRSVVESTFNLIEPLDPLHSPKHALFDGVDFSRKNSKSPNRGGIASLFGPISLRRCLYEPLSEARDQQLPSFSPLELSLGIVAGNATPALAERVGKLSADRTQSEVLDLLQSEYQVSWSVTTLRAVTSALHEGIAGHLQPALHVELLRLLSKASASQGPHHVVLAVGRDGVMVSVRGENYKEAAVATISVYDKNAERVGTVYLAEMPEPKQKTLSKELTELVEKVLKSWQGEMPRLVYLTDAGQHQRGYYEEVLKKMENPREAGRKLQWMWVVDFYHAAEYVSKMAKVLFKEEKQAQEWARRMRGVMLQEKGGVKKVLASAAQYYGREKRSNGEKKEYLEAYRYLLKYNKQMKYSEYKQEGIPIGSGVTEAGCKVVFTQRFKGSGMTWYRQGADVILTLRLAVLSGVWDAVFAAYLAQRPQACFLT